MKNLDFLPQEVKEVIEKRVEESSKKNKETKENVEKLIDAGVTGMDEKEFEYYKYIDAKYDSLVAELDKVIEDDKSSKELVKRAKDLKKNFLSIYQCKFFGKDLITECKKDFSKLKMITVKSKGLQKMTNSKEYEFSDPQLITSYMAQSLKFTEAEHEMLQYIFYSYVCENHLGLVEKNVNEFIQFMTLLTIVPFTSDSNWVNGFVQNLKKLLK
jgi:Mg2+ and Co2+ transporter CorA